VFKWARSIKASIKTYKKLHIATSVADSIDQAFSHQAFAASDLFSDDNYPLTSGQLVQITYDNLIPRD
jgi:hypothetical protein